jgi:hypothetical protein
MAFVWAQGPMALDDLCVRWRGPQRAASLNPEKGFVRRCVVAMAIDRRAFRGGQTEGAGERTGPPPRPARQIEANPE